MPGQPGGIDTTGYLFDYYLSDSFSYKSNFIGGQGQLINNSYRFPKDTSGSYQGKTMFYMNYDCINSITVAFDSLYSNNTPTPWSILSVTIDTIYVPIIQVNHSNHPDTLEIQLNSVDERGYPQLAPFLLDTLIIDTNIGNRNNYSVNVIKWATNGYQVPGGTKFAVSVTYFDSTKLDSCWFIYGYGAFKDTCPTRQKGDAALAYPTNFSKISALPKPFIANSFALWNEYVGHGLLPDQTGDDVYFPCDTNDKTFHPKVDGANYLQDIDIATYIQLVVNTGIAKINPAQLNVVQNYPNPFSDKSTINYTIAKPADVNLKVVDLTGRELLVQEYTNVAPGEHSIVINGDILAPGIYFYCISSSNYTVTKKMVVN